MNNQVRGNNVKTLRNKLWKKKKKEFRNFSHLLLNLDQLFKCMLQIDFNKNRISP